MQFSVDSKHLLDAIKKTRCVFPKKIIAPISSYYYVEVKPGKLTISCSNFRQYFSAECTATTTDEFQFCVAATALRRILKNIEPTELDFYYAEIGLNKLHVQFGSTNIELLTLPFSDSPKPPVCTELSEYIIDQNALLTAINRVSFATSTDTYRPAMEGVFLKFDDNTCNVVATNGHMLAIDAFSLNYDAMPKSIIIPAEAIKIIEATFSNAHPVSIRFSNSVAIISQNTIELRTRLTDERYPDFENVIPTEFTTILTINRTSLLGAVGLIKKFSSKDLEFLIEENTLKLSNQDFEDVKVSTSLTCITEGKNYLIGFNCKYLMQILQRHQSENVVFNIVSPKRAVIINTDNDSAYFNLLMPTVLNYDDY